MWDVVLALAFSVLVGLLGLGLAGWMVLSGSSFASVDNLFLTLFGGLLVVCGFGYAGWMLSRSS